MKRLLIAGVLVLVAVMTVVACAKPAPTPTPTRAAVATPTQAAVATPTPAPTAPPAKVYTLKFAGAGGWSDIVPVWPTFKKVLEERSGGRIQIKDFLGGEHPLGADDYAPAVRDRLFDMSYQDSGYLSTPEPEVGMLDLPLLLAGSGSAIQEYHDMFDKFRGETYDPAFDKYNMILLFNWTWGVLSPTLKTKLVPTLDSLRGVKLRTFSKQSTDGVAALGAVPVSMSWDEFMTALQRGVVDGWVMSMAAQVQYATFEQMKFYTYMSFQQTTGGVGINKDAFEELPQDLQNIMLQTGKEFAKVAWDSAQDQENWGAYQGIVQYGVTFGRMPPSEERKAAEKMKPLWDAWVAKVGPQGPDLLKRILAYHEEWISAHK